MTSHHAVRRAGRPRIKPDEQPTKQRILETAAELFSRHGFTGVSIRDITKAVGIKESSLYNHFQHKEALLDAVFDRMEREFASRDLAEERLRTEILEKTPEEFMRASFQRFMNFWKDPVRIKLWLVVSIEQYRNQRAGELILHESRRVMKLAEFAFASMRSMDKIRSLDPRTLAEIYTGTLRGMQMEMAILMSAGRNVSGVRRRADEFISFFASLITNG